MNNICIKDINESTTIGYKIAKEFFKWENMNFVDRDYKSGQVVYLAKLIDEVFKKEKSE